MSTFTYGAYTVTKPRQQSAPRDAVSRRVSAGMRLIHAAESDDRSGGFNPRGLLGHVIASGRPRPFSPVELSFDNTATVGPDEPRPVCASLSPALFDGAGTLDARRACGACPIRQRCLEDALANGDDGFRGGYSETERKRIFGKKAS